MCPPVVGSSNLFCVGNNGMRFEMMRIRLSGMRMEVAPAGRTHRSAPTGELFDCANFIGVCGFGR